MTIEHMTEQALLLPLAERVVLAQALWESIQDTGAETSNEAETLAIARRRAAELDSGVAVGRSHEQVMEAARRVLRCE